MAEKQIFRVGIVMTGDTGVQVRSGASTTRAAVLAETDDGFNNPPVGSLYLSTAGKGYIRVAENGAAADWEKITTSAAD